MMLGDGRERPVFDRRLTSRGFVRSTLVGTERVWHRMRAFNQYGGGTGEKELSASVVAKSNRPVAPQAPALLRK